MDTLQLKALADDSRLAIVRFLARGEACVCEIAEQLEMSVALVSHHVTRLEDAGVIASHKVGRWRHCSLVPAAIDELAADLAGTAEAARRAAEAAAEHAAESGDAPAAPAVACGACGPTRKDTP